MPKVMRDQLAASSSSSRSYSTSARLGQQQMDQNQSSTDPSIATVASMIYNPQQPASVAMQPIPEGYKFEPPSMTLPRSENVKKRYDPLVEQFTKLLMRDGKLSHAQKVCLNQLCSPI